MKKRGIADGNFRADSISWPIVEELFRDKQAEPNSIAAEARKRLIERMEQQNKETGGAVTDEVVREYMGGLDGAAKQAAEYQALFDRIKATGYTTDEADETSIAAAARRRMIARENQGSEGRADGEAEYKHIISVDELERVYINARYR